LASIEQGFKSRLSEMETGISKVDKSLENKITEVDQESVECRRLHKETLRYRELRQQASELLDNLEKHITFAALIG
jgi:hypothetical protein